MDAITSLTKSLHKAINSGDKKIQYEIQLKIAQYYYNEENYHLSKSHLRQILHQNPKYLNVNYYLGLCELNLGNDENAQKFFKTELKHNPNHQFAKDILKNFQIKSNFPTNTILIILISIITYLTTNQNYETFLKFGASTFNLTFFSTTTSIFFHSNLIHLILNSIFLLMFGIYLEKHIGNIKFLTIFLIGGIIGNLTQALFYPEGFVIGMSSGIFAIFGAIVTKEPLLKFKLFGIFNTPLIILFGIVFTLQYLTTELIHFENLLFGEIAHLFGFLCGLLIMVTLNQELIFVFYHWLIISFGFIGATYSIKILTHHAIEIITQKIQLNFLQSIGHTTLFIISFTIIYYAYTKLKTQILLEQEETN